MFKAHVQVGRYDPTDPLLDGAWGVIEDAGVPVVIHCGSGPQPGEHTGPGPIRTLLTAHPRLRLIIAHLGMPEYAEFLDVCERHDGVHLDTTMAFTPFSEETMPIPADAYPRLRNVGDRILFGSDFPNIPYRYVDAVRSVTRLDGFDVDWRRGVLHDNAVRLFGLN
ncbi:hypothetical protein MARA_34190 [Mycolicibacterium arabiense]|uniref:Amidohydrolase-related domain-containing protein n=1 Tax=Mycolicibacterium arabiense TaxID=1286181 RepID=A0A7I7S0F6_9MYCO|nr:hypothetical protein MARA_34190 [Mycolicibacterium arabiense]